MFINTSLAAENSGSKIVNSISSIDIFGGFSLSGIFGWALTLGATAALGIVVYAGILYIASAGNPSRREDAIEWIKAAIYGLLLLAGGWLILYVLNPSILGG